MRFTSRFLLSFVAALGLDAAAAVPMLGLDMPKALSPQPATIKSVARPVRFNAAGLRDLKPGTEVELALPDGTRHVFVFDLARDHGDGIRSWVGYYRDGDMRRKLRAIVTSGPDGTFGTLQTPSGEYQLVPGRGHDWLVDMKAEAPLHEEPDLAADGVPAPRAPRVPRKSLGVAPGAQAEFAEAIPGVTVPLSTKVAQTPSTVVVDVLFVYTAGLAAQLPGSQLQTRLAQLITTANTAYADSHVGITLRMAGSTMVNYPDDADAYTALSDITYGNGVFSGIAKLRDDTGADVVTLLRGGGGFSGSGLSWIPSHALSSDDAWLMYSSVTGCTQGCDWLWVHELGHNMGNAHDRATVAWEVSAFNQPESKGSFDYSYGFYTCDGAIDDTALSCPAFGGGCTTAEPQCKVTNAGRNFADIMAYFHGSTRLLQFSNPDLRCAGTDLACGLPQGTLVGGRAASADTARSMNDNRLALSAMRGGSTARASAGTNLSLAASTNPARAATTVTFTSTVTTADTTHSAIPEGAVEFRDNGAVIAGCGTVPVSSGQARCAVVLAAGSHSISAAYLGTATYLPSGAATLAESVAPMPALALLPPHKVDFDGDGHGDLSWASANRTAGIWLMAASLPRDGNTVAAPAGTTLRALADFDGDGRTDALWRGDDGSYWITLQQGIQVTGMRQIFQPAGGWEVVGVGDFNGDGRADLLWESADGRHGTWLMNGLDVIACPSVVVPADARPAAVADFNGDRVADVLWQFADGRIGVTTMSGGSAGTLAIVQAAGAPWRPVAVGDFDGDGRADVALASADGSLAGWLMNGNAIASSAVLLQAGSGWSVSGVGDLDGDGRADLLFTHAGDLVTGAWLMNGLQPTAGAPFANTPGAGWNVAALGDFDGDGRADILFRKTTGEYAVSLMNGLSATTTRSVLASGSGWEATP